MIVREAFRSDIPTIIDFQLKMALETENLVLDKDTITNGVKAVFEDPNKGRYFIVEKAGEVISSMMITYEWSDWRNATVVWLQSVYVLTEYRRKGMFRIMYDHIRNIVKEDDTYKGIRLYVDQSNVNAQKTYEAMGMTAEHYNMYEWFE
ncbi:MAG: GNAT family N-acetyltransferase [Hyphomicrobiales bacterium]